MGARLGRCFVGAVGGARPARGPVKVGAVWWLAAGVGCSSTLCPFPLDGEMPEGNWVQATEFGYAVNNGIAIGVDQFGHASISNECGIAGKVEQASVEDGHIGWDVDWYAPEGVGGEPAHVGPGTITGDICGHSATFALDPVAAETDFRDDIVWTGAACD